MLAQYFPVTYAVNFNQLAVTRNARLCAAGAPPDFALAMPPLIRLGSASCLLCRWAPLPNPHESSISAMCSRQGLCEILVARPDGHLHPMHQPDQVTNIKPH